MRNLSRGSRFPSTSWASKKTDKSFVKVESRRLQQIEDLKIGSTGHGTIVHMQVQNSWRIPLDLRDISAKLLK